MHMQEKRYLLCIHSGRLIWFQVYDAAAYFAMKALKKPSMMSAVSLEQNKFL